MKKLGWLIIIMLVGCTSSRPIDAKETRLMVVSDIHYLSDELNDHGEAFQSLMQGSDGKYMEEIEVIVDGLVASVEEEKPDALIISGDLTFNGESVSHEQLAKRLSSLATQVLVIPGNHDLYNSSAACFKGDSYSHVANVDMTDFIDSYNDMGYAQAIYKDEVSNSYVYEINDLWILMLDTNSKANNEVLEKTYQWLEEVLKKAKSASKRVIGVSHQNLYAHSDLLYIGFQIKEDNRLIELYEQYDVVCNLSGHMHLQHIIDREVAEIATSSLSVYPFHYGMMRVKGDEVTYEAKEIKVSEEVRDKALAWFNECSKAHIEWYFEDYTEEEKKVMLNTFQALNLHYFMGTPVTKDINAGMKLWEEVEEDHFSLYVKSMIKEKDRNHTYYFHKE